MLQTGRGQQWARLRSCGLVGASTIRSSRAFKHPNGAALRIAPLFGPALSDHVRAGPFGLREAAQELGGPILSGGCSWSPRVTGQRS